GRAAVHRQRRTSITPAAPTGLNWLSGRGGVAALGRQAVLAPCGRREQLRLGPRPAHHPERQRQPPLPPAPQEPHPPPAPAAPPPASPDGTHPAAGPVNSHGGLRPGSPLLRAPGAGPVAPGAGSASPPSNPPSTASPSRRWCSLQRAYSAAGHASPSSRRPR